MIYTGAAVTNCASTYNCARSYARKHFSNVIWDDYSKLVMEFFET